MQGIEFYMVNDELWLKTDDDSRRLSVHDLSLVEQLYSDLESTFPQAISALRSLYAKSKAYKPFYLFKIVNRFCRCNFGNIDNILDIDESGCYHLEYVQCPLRGECPHENIVCNPQYATILSPSELRVMRLLVAGATRTAIADSLCLSIHTVNNHVNNAYRKTGTHNLPEFMRYSDNKQLL